MQFKRELNAYVDAGYPIIYVNSYEETKVDAIIREVMGGRQGLEWNGAKGFCDFKSKQILINGNGKTLSDTLEFLCCSDELERKYLVIKDAHLFFNDAKVITCLKDIALQISTGLDSAVIIVSSIIKLPKELEKFVTIIEMGFPTQNEIRSLIKKFSDEQSAPPIHSVLYHRFLP